MTTVRYVFRMLGYLFLLLVGAAAATLIVSNYDQRVAVYFTSSIRTVEAPLSVVLFATLISGFVLSALLSLTGRFRLRSKIRSQKSSIERLENDLAELRKLPIADSLPALDEVESETSDTTSA